MQFQSCLYQLQYIGILNIIFIKSTLLATLGLRPFGFSLDSSTEKKYFKASVPARLSMGILFKDRLRLRD
jgi:hypothetical protein